MDRRQKKTREAIFNGFFKLLGKKSVDKITVGEIIEEADVGRATFYAHFETKEFLLKEMCKELFCHIFDSLQNNSEHTHIFNCIAPDSVFLHLFQHFYKNDNRILELISLKDNDVFEKYFRKELINLIETQIEVKDEALPTNLVNEHIASSFISTVLWWKNNGLKESPEEINGYFLMLIKKFLKN